MLLAFRYKSSAKLFFHCACVLCVCNCITDLSSMVGKWFRALLVHKRQVYLVESESRRKRSALLEQVLRKAKDSIAFAVFYLIESELRQKRPAL